MPQYPQGGKNRTLGALLSPALYDAYRRAVEEEGDGPTMFMARALVHYMRHSSPAEVAEGLAAPAADRPGAVTQGGRRGRMATFKAHPVLVEAVEDMERGSGVTRSEIVRQALMSYLHAAHPGVLATGGGRAIEPEARAPSKVEQVRGIPREIGLAPPRGPAPVRPADEAGWSSAGPALDWSASHPLDWLVQQHREAADFVEIHEEPRADVDAIEAMIDRVIELWRLVRSRNVQSPIADFDTLEQLFERELRDFIMDRERVRRGPPNPVTVPELQERAERLAERLAKELVQIESPHPREGPAERRPASRKTKR